MKRLLKILLAVLIFFLAAISGLAIYIKVKYPSERLRQLLISYLASEYKLRVAVARLDFNLFSGFELDNVALLGATKDTVPTPGGSPLSIEKIRFAYRWRSLLARRLEIDEVTIERPAFFYQLNPDSSSNLDALLAAFADSTTPPSDTSSTGLPISIHLKTLGLENLRIKAVLNSTIDSQRFELGPLDLFVSEIEVDRQANFGGKMRLRAESANVHYRTALVGQGEALALAANLTSDITGAVRGDSIGLQGGLAFDDSQIHWGASDFSLPRLGTTAVVRYNLASSKLEAPDIRLLIDDKEQLATRFAMAPQNGISAFALHINRGEVDLAHVLQLARTHTSGEMYAYLQKIDCAGALEFSGSELANDQHGMAYQIALRGRDLAYHDHASGLGFDGGQLHLDWKSRADSSAEIAGQIHLTAMDVPIDSVQTIKTGPVDLKTAWALTKDFLPQRGDIDLRWQNFSEGKIEMRANLSASPGARARLAHFSGAAEIKADSLEISPFTAGAASGRISSLFKVAGKRLDELELTLHLHNSTIPYETIEYQGKLPAYHLAASSKLLVNSALTQFILPNGKLQIEPAQASFDATYDMKADTFRFNFPTLALDLAQVMRALPDTIRASMNYAKVKGHAAGSGWWKGQLLEPDSLDYHGIFVLHSEDGAYADSALGIYTDSLQINSEWSLTPSTTLGKYTVSCSTPKLPDYLRQPLPPTKAAGKLTVDETTFTITDGKFEIPKWSAKGSYRLDGEFRPTGLQLRTTVDLGMHAPQSIAFDRGVMLRGDLDGHFVIDQYFPDALAAPQPVQLNGWLRCDGLDVKMDTTLALHNLKAVCHFDQDFDLLYLPPESMMTKGMMLEPDDDFQPYLVLKPSEKSTAPIYAKADEALLMYDLFRDAKDKDAGERSRLTIEKIDALDYQFTNLTADLNIGNCRFDIPRFSMNFFDGNLVGNLLVGLGNGNPDSISYATDMQISSLDISGFRRLRAQLGGKQSRISANFELSGLGAAPAKLEGIVNNLSGRLNITKIENKVASNLLQMLDPNGTDKGIQNIRLLMKARWNVRQLTFELKNGFVYASLTHAKPWYAPFKVPQPLDFARFPVQPYLKTTANE